MVQKQYQVDELFLNETTADEFQVDGLYLNENAAGVVSGRITARPRHSALASILPIVSAAIRRPLLRPADSRPVQPRQRQTTDVDGLLMLLNGTSQRRALLRPDPVAPATGRDTRSRRSMPAESPDLATFAPARRPLLRAGDSRPVQPVRRHARPDPVELLAIDPLPPWRPPLLRPGDSRPVQPQRRQTVDVDAQLLVIFMPSPRRGLLRPDPVAPVTGRDTRCRRSVAPEIPGPPLARVFRRALLRSGDSRPVQPARRVARPDSIELLIIDPLPAWRSPLLRPDPVAPTSGGLGSNRRSLVELPWWELARGRTWRSPLLRPDLTACTPSNGTLWPDHNLAITQAATGGVEIRRIDATTPDEIIVRFASAHDGWLHQLYLGRQLIDRTWLPEQRTLVGKISGAEWPEPLQILAVHPDIADLDFGDQLPARPYNRVRLDWRAAGFPSDAAFFDVTAGTAPLVDADPTNQLTRILYNGDIGYSYLSDPLAGSGYWNFEITARDDRPADGNAGTVACARERVLAYPPDVEPSGGSRFGLSLAAGVATFTVTLPA